MKRTILIAAIITLVLIGVLAIAAISLQGLEFKTVISGSMSPVINTGDVVAITKVNTEELKLGDIITFGDGKTFTTHRIIGITAEGFRTKGDANEDPDMEVIKRQDVVGKVVFTIPYLGYLGSFVRTPMGFAILILIPGALIILTEAVKIKDELRPKKPALPGLEYRSRAHDTHVHSHKDMQSISHAKWAEKRVDHSKYESLQKDLEKE